jgi:hypothetical protein
LAGLLAGADAVTTQGIDDASNTPRNDSLLFIGVSWFGWARWT